MEINATAISKIMHDTLIGAGMGSLMGHVVSYILPFASMAPLAGTVFGAVFILAKCIDEKAYEMLAKGLNVLLAHTSNDFKENYGNWILLSSLYALHGCVAYVATALFVSGLSPLGALALTATFLAVDIASTVFFDKLWMTGVGELEDTEFDDYETTSEPLYATGFRACDEVREGVTVE